MKKTTTLTINDEVIKEAKERGINISQLTENALKREFGEVTFNTNDGSKCQFCNEEGIKATKENLTGICWLWPDEMWICNKCLREKNKRVPYTMF